MAGRSAWASKTVQALATADGRCHYRCCSSVFSAGRCLAPQPSRGPRAAPPLTRRPTPGAGSVEPRRCLYDFGRVDEELVDEGGVAVPFEDVVVPAVPVPVVPVPVVALLEQIGRASCRERV